MSEPDKDVIDLAERLLRMARTGECSSFVAMIVVGDAVQSMWVGDFERHRMIGQIEVMKLDLADGIMSDRMEPPAPGPKGV